MRTPATSSRRPRWRASANPIADFLQACRVGDCAAFRSFVQAHCHAKVLAKPEKVEEFVAAFARLREDFGPLEARSSVYDTTHRSTKHHLYSPALQQGVTLSGSACGPPPMLLQ